MTEIPTYFIDFETSGIAPDSYPIEVAVVYPGGEYQSLIRPAAYWDHWSYDAQDMHGLRREQLISEGQTPLAVAQEMNRLYGRKTLCSDNPADCFWLDVLYEAAGIEPTFCVSPLEVFIGREAATEALALRPPFRVHRALGDARALADCMNLYLQMHSLGEQVVLSHAGFQYVGNSICSHVASLKERAPQGPFALKLTSYCQRCLVSQLSGSAPACAPKLGRGTGFHHRSWRRMSHEWQVDLI